MTYNQLSVEKRISKAKVNLILNQPWFGQLAMRLIMLDGEGQGVDTMATDGTHLYYHGGFVQSLSDTELMGVIAHEIMHCAMLHPYRRENRNALQWNIACDLVINDTLINAGFSLPKGVLIDKSYSGLSAEKAYAMLSKQSKQPQPCPWGKVMDSPQPQGDGKGKGQGDGDKPGDKPGDGKGQEKGQGKGNQSKPGDGDGDGDKPGSSGNQSGQGKGQDTGQAVRTETDWIIDTIQAEKIATSAGKMPGGIGSELRKSRQTKTNYRDVLRRFMDRTVPTDYTWAMPKRRFLSQGIVLPGVHKENCGELVIGVDTSGSVGRGMLDQFAADIASIISEYRPTKTHVVYCDTRVTRTDEFEADGTPFEFAEKVSRGGTLFQPVFDWVEDQGINPRALIYLTDLEPGDVPNEPAYPVLWGVPETCTRKDWGFGEVVEVTMDHK